MEVYRSLETLTPDQNNIITTGTFDGLHLGHQFIIEKLRELAVSLNGKTALISFHPHPKQVLKKPDGDKVELLTTVEEKTDLLAKFGIEKLILIPFTQSFSRLTSEAYVSEILCRKIGMKGIVIGHDHAFGRDREGGIATLKKLAPVKDFEVVPLGAFSSNGTTVSSTLIRRLLAAGELDQANAFLGFPYFVIGSVVRGEGRGRGIGFPTANIEIETNKLLPKRGVYVVELEIDGKNYHGMANIGVKPTFGEEPETLEAHIFDFCTDLYGKKIKLAFRKRLRNEQKFGSVVELTNQLKLDKKNSLRFLSAARHS